MRFVAAVLACLGIGSASGALADPPPSPAEQSAVAEPAPATPTSATEAAPTRSATEAAPTRSATEAATAKAPVTAPQTASAAKPGVDPEEQRLMAQGYRPKMRHGHKVFCRTDPELGSRLGGQEICATVEELKARQTAVREELEREQRSKMASPAGN
jgi:hypothetical protein